MTFLVDFPYFFGESCHKLHSCIKIKLLSINIFSIKFRISKCISILISYSVIHTLNVQQTTIYEDYR